MKEGQSPSPLRSETAGADSTIVKPEWASRRETPDQVVQDLIRIRYEYILRQIQAIDENVHRFLAIYQTFLTALVVGQVLLFLNHRRWSLTVQTTNTALIGILVLETIVACFAALMIIIGIINWIDYRNEECDISDVIMGEDFRQRPSRRNWLRWHETYVVAFILVSVVAIWTLVLGFMIPSVD